MKILCAFGEYNYGKRERGQGYEFSNFLPALKALGHDVVFFETLDRDRYSDFAHLNRLFIEMVQKERPDVIFCTLMHYELWLETLDLAKGICDATFINWATDDSWKYRQFSRLIASHFDLYATTYVTALEKAKQDGLDNFYLTQWAASGKTLQAPLAAKDCRYSVSFVGSCYGNRMKWIEGLRQRGVTVDCFGHGWDNGPVAAEEIPRIIQNSAISLNFGDSETMMDGFSFARSRQIKARIFEVPGCGGFLLTQPADDLDRYYTPGLEVATFNDLEDLALKIDHYLNHHDERDKIARAAHEKTRSEHTYEIRFAKLLETAGYRVNNEHNPKNAKACSSPVREFADFPILEARHKPNAYLRFLREALTFPCVILWGKQRGPRAARRILFELSWRLCGSTTYSASGWPGRLFYRQS
ncbi:MAG: CgeB family protein [Smithellaceae bacterium]